jgi:hypothetical protein
MDPCFLVVNQIGSEIIGVMTKFLLECIGVMLKFLLVMTKFLLVGDDEVLMLLKFLLVMTRNFYWLVMMKF